MLVRRSPRRPDGSHRGRPRRHRPGPLGRGHRRVPLGADRRLGGARRHRGSCVDAGRRASPPICSRPTPTTWCFDGDAGRVPRGRHPGGADRPGTSSPPLGRREPARSSRLRLHGQAGRRSRSAPTWPWSRSTPRPGKVDARRASWQSTTPARILNPLLAEGQVHGGLAQGVAQALLEEVRFDDDGNPLTVHLRRLRGHLGGRAADVRA